MKTLLLGGSGLLGGATLQRLLAAGHAVTVLSRGVQPLPPHPRLRALTADRRDDGALAAALQGQRFEFTVDFLAYTAEDVARLFAVPDFDPGRVVMLSTGQVYLVGDRAPPSREPDADTPILPEPPRDTRAWHNWVYGTHKRAAEAALRATGRATLALRVPAVQGEADGRASKRLWAWLERMCDGGPVLLPDDGVQPIRHVYAGDVAEALLAMSGGELWPPGPALNLAQPAELTLRALLEQVADCAGLRPQLVPVRGEALHEAGLDEASAPYWGPFNSRPDPAAALALGFRTRDPSAYLPSVVRAHLAERPGSHEGYANRPAELALARRLMG